jgi:hypothetical protein
VAEKERHFGATLALVALQDNHPGAKLILLSRNFGKGFRLKLRLHALRTCSKVIPPFENLVESLELGPNDTDLNGCRDGFVILRLPVCEQ